MKVCCALVQMRLSADRAENVERAGEYIREAAAGGAKVICLPELATSIYMCFTEDAALRELAEPLGGRSVRAISKTARSAGAYVIYPFYERGEDDLLYNTAAVIDPHGDVVGCYRKNSIPDVRLPDMVGAEKFYFRPGNLGYPVFETASGLKVGVTISYERHHFEGPRILALRGADVIFVPTATGAGRQLWEVELRGHAIANRIWVGAVNRVGRDEGSPNEAVFFGDSLWVDPAGTVIARAGDANSELVFAQVDTDVSRVLREKWGFFRDRRPEIFARVSRP
jgi:beta-ureidopropionase